MDNLNKPHVLILSLLAALLLITPTLSSKLGPTYLYFVTNILIIALGFEAASFPSSTIPLMLNEEPITTIPGRKTQHCRNHTIWPWLWDGDLSHQVVMDMGAVPALSYDTITNKKTENSGDRVKVVENCLSEKAGMMNVGGKEENNFKRCPSTPSLSFIGGAPVAETRNNGCEFDFGRDQDYEPVDEGIISGQELFTKAETFIDNFHKQLTMQKEESWKKIHGIYQKAF